MSEENAFQSLEAMTGKILSPLQKKKKRETSKEDEEEPMRKSLGVMVVVTL